MILRHLKLSGIGCFPDKVAVGPFDPGANLVIGHNGDGKSTLIAALRLAFFYGHDSTAQPVRAWSPWGRELSPAITVEIDYENKRYRIRKEFIDPKRVRLDVWEDGKYTQLTRGKRADKRIAAMLMGKKNPTESTLAKYGLAQILWTPRQGDLSLPPLDSDVTSHLQQALEAEVQTATTDLETRLAKEVDAVFTEKTGKPRKDSPRNQLDLAIVEKEEKLIAIQEQLAEFEELREEAQEREAEAEKAAANAVTLRAKHAELHEQLQEKRALEVSLQQHNKHLGLLQERAKRLQQEIDAIARYRAELAEIEDEQTNAAETRKALQQALDDQTAAEIDLETEREAAQEAVEKVREQEHIQARWRDLADARARAQRARETLAAVATIQRDLAEAERERDAVVAPDAPTLKLIRQVLRKRDDLQQRLEASAVTLEIEPHADGEVHVTGEDEPRVLRTGESLELRGTPEVHADLPGVARLIARPPASSEGESVTAATVDAAQASVRKLCTPYGTESLDDLEALREARQEASQAIARHEQALEVRLNGRAEAALQTDLDTAEREATALLTRHPDLDAGDPEDAPTAEAIAAERQQAEVALRNLEKRAKTLQAELRNAQKALDQFEARQQANAHRRDKAAEALARHLADGRSDAERQEGLADARRECETAAAERQRIMDRLAAFPKQLEQQASRAQSDLDEAREREGEARDRAHRIHGQLQQLSKAGVYTQWATLQERLEADRERLQRIKAQTDALKLLHNTIQDFRKRALSQVATPVEERVRDILQRIGWSHAGTVALGESLQAKTVHLDEGPDKPIELTRLSNGEREQLLLATRIALAERLAAAAGTRHCLLLDDPLTQTDDDRIARFLTVLEEVAATLQVVVLTCHPSRYAPMTAARLEIAPAE